MERHIYNIAELTPNYSIRVKSADRHKLVDSNSAADILRQYIGGAVEWKEEFIIMCLNRANQVLCLTKVSSGGVSATVADPKIIFQIALLANASGVILCHNHPSGNTQPSKEDDRLTKQLSECGKLLQINVLDHIIVTSEDYYSYADNGRM